MSSTDPGGGGSSVEGTPDFQQQQAKINQLKELVRQSEAAQGKNNASAQEKVKNIAQRLNSLKTKARSRQGEKSITNVSDKTLKMSEQEKVAAPFEIIDEPTKETAAPPPARARSETPGSEKIQLLRKQMEQNRQKMAERENNKRGIEELVTQLKAKFDSNQMSIESSAHLGRSIGDLSILSPSMQRDKFQSSSDVSTTFATNFDKDRIRYLEKKNAELEIQMKNRENEFLHRDPNSEHLKTIKNLENKILDLEESLKEKECLIEARTQAVSLLSENMSMKGKNTVDLLEDTKQEMYSMQQQFIVNEEKYTAEIAKLKEEIAERDNKIANMEEINDILETTRYDLTIKNSELENKIAEVQDFSIKISELTKQNQTLQHRITELESIKSDSTAEGEEKLHALESQVEIIQTENDDLIKLLQNTEQPDTDTDLQDKIKVLEASIVALKEQIAAQLIRLETMENNLEEKTIEYNVLNANFSVLQEKLKSSAPKSLFSTTTDEEAEAEINKLKAQLDDANKAAIKMKLKNKQLQKQVDAAKKTSETSKELIALTDQNQALQQRIIELEQMKAPDLPDSDLSQRIRVLETTCQNQISAIQLLELQKVDMDQDLHSTKDELTTLKDHLKDVDESDTTARVTTHMDIIEKEEKIEEYLHQIAELHAENDKLSEENIVLLDKLEKLNKGSSAESIEIVENLTQQEKLEMEAFQKALENKSENVTEISQDLSDSLIQLREESSELMHKIEMFTNERREVLDKMEAIKSENSNLIADIALLNDEKRKLELIISDLELNEEQLAKALSESREEQLELTANVRELRESRQQLQEELNSLIKINAAASCTILPEIPAVEFNKDGYVRGVKSLEFQMECYRKGKDKNAKFEVSKKLVKEAKNVQELMNKLISEYEFCMQNYQMLQAEVEMVKQSMAIKPDIGDVVLKSNYDRLQADFQSTVNKLKKLEEKVKSQSDEGVGLHKKLQEKELELKDQLKAIADLQAEYDRIKLLNEKLEESLDSEQKKITELQENSDHVLDTTKNELKKLKEINVNFKNDLELMENDNKSELKQVKDDLNNRLLVATNEIEILKSLCAEQKQQLIELLTDHEQELEEKAQTIGQLEKKLKESSIQIASSNESLLNSLQEKIDNLQADLNENNQLLKSQGSELKMKQETIETLNAQIMELYKVMEENTNKVLEKDDEIVYLQELLDANKDEIQVLQEKCQLNESTVSKLNARVDEKQKEIHALENKQQLPPQDDTAKAMLEANVSLLEQNVQQLEAKNKETLDKLKKFAANLKKKNAQCTELELQISKMQENVNHHQHLLAQKDEELNMIRHENSKISVSLQQSSNADDRLQQQKQQQLNVISQRNKDLEEQLNQLNIMVEVNQRDIDSKNAELDNFTSRLDDKVTLLNELTKECEEKDGELALLRNSLKEFDALKIQLNATAEDLHNRNLKFEKCKAVIKEKNKEIKRLQDVSTALEEKLRVSEESTVASVVDTGANYEKICEEYILFQETAAANMNKLQAELKDNEKQYREHLQAQELELENNLRQFQEASEYKMAQVQQELQQSKNDFDLQVQKFQQTHQENQNATSKLKLLHDQEVARLLHDLEQKNLDLDNLKTSYQSENMNLQSLLQENEQAHKQSMQDYQRQLQHLSTELEMHSNNVSNQHTVAALELKIQENELFIETIQIENDQLKEKISKLEEGIGYIEERRLSLERQSDLLGETLAIKTSEFAQNEDKLLQRLSALSNHDDVVANKLAEVERDRIELVDKLAEVNETNSELVKEVSTLNEEILELKSNNKLEDEIALLQKDNVNLQAELKRQSIEFEKRLEEKREEVDTLENDLSVQLEKIENERKSLQEQLEKSKDDNSEIQYDIVRFKEIITSLEQSNSDLEREMTWIKMQNDVLNQDQLEAQELRMQIVHDQTEIENLKTQSASMLLSHETEVNTLKQQLAELDSLRTQIGQNQTDDQMFIQNENERLQTLLAAKELEIQNYQRQNLQLQMSSRPTTAAIFAAPPPPNDPFAVLSNLSNASVSNSNDPFAMFTAISAEPLQSAAEHNEKLMVTERLKTAENQLVNLNGEVTNLRKQNSDLLNERSSQLVLIDELKSAQNGLAGNVAMLQNLQTQNIHLQSLCHEREEEIKTLQSDLTAAQEVVVQATSVQAVGAMAVPFTEAPHNNAPNTAELQANIASMEQYINQLQLQMRISTNDYEQLTQTIDSLENEIRNRNIAHETEIKQLQHKLAKFEAAELEKLIQPQAEEMVAGTIASNVPSFNSSAFFNETASSVFDDAIPEQTNVPVVEEPCVAKKAYICHPAPAVELGETDDGWGFGSDEAALEEQHQKLSANPLSLLPSSTTLEIALQESTNTIQELELERDRLRAENLALQVKSGKMLKKLKEYKAKNEELATSHTSFHKSGSVDSTNDLDLAIQEELNNRVATLENRLKECKAEQEKETAEKSSLLNRLDVLTAANDRLTEMKESQDKEMEFCKTKIRKLSQKLEKLEEWSDNNYNEKLPETPSVGGDQQTSTTSTEVVNLTKQIMEMRLDNEELQNMLDEEKDHNRELEERIKKLQETLVTKTNHEEELNETREKLKKLSNDYEWQKKDIASKQARLDEAELKIEQLKSQMNENCATIDDLSLESTNIKSYLDQLKDEHKHKIDENNNLSKELKILSEKNAEMSEELSRMRSSSGLFEDANKAEEAEQQIQNLMDTIQYKDAEILQLNAKLGEAIEQDQTQSLVQEILAKNAEINQLRTLSQQLQTEKTELENNLSLQLTREMVAAENSHPELEKVIADLKNEKHNMEEELNVLNDQVIKSLELEDRIKLTALEVDSKNIEIIELKNSLFQLRQQIPENVSTNVDEQNERITQLENHVESLSVHYEQVVEQRCVELAESWRQHLAQREAEFESVQIGLQQEIARLSQGASVSTPVNAGDHSESIKPDANNPPAEYDIDLVNKMQEALESQEVEIVTLKEQLAIRSAEYARIASQVDPFASSKGIMNIDLAAKKSAEAKTSELDLALYMLHQRDMTCEELTEELIHMLQERDTLQLKLSNSIRQIENYKSKIGEIEVPSDAESTDTSPEKTRSIISSGASDQSQENLQQYTHINDKVTQLHGLSHSRDKTLREERDQRQRQMALLQRGVSNLPPEAVAQLIGNDSSLNRKQSESSSSALLNWLWGKSTPKPPE